MNSTTRPSWTRARCGRPPSGAAAHTGSFRWKGDPRMQPRDRFAFVRKDGTKQNCTIEGITLAHAGGGTYADITYREEGP